MAQDDPYQIRDLPALERLYAPANPNSLAKEADHVHDVYRPFIEAAPFLVLATCGDGGLDASPRGDPAGFVVVEDPRTLLIPDRRGNNRLDSLRNIVTDPRVGLLFMIPGVDETLRVNGRAHLSTDPARLARFEVAGRQPACVVVVAVETVYFQCSRALLRSRLWDPSTHLPREKLPSAGTILKAMLAGEFDDATYDRDAAQRMRGSLY